MGDESLEGLGNVRDGKGKEVCGRNLERVEMALSFKAVGEWDAGTGVSSHPHPPAADGLSWTQVEHSRNRTIER